MKSSLLLILLFTSSLVMFSQGNGTTFKSINKCYEKTYSVSVHIMEDTLGELNISDADIQAGIELANVHFSKICASFNICSTYVHPNVRNDKIIQGIEDKEIAAMYDVPNTINIYYGISVISGTTQTCGFAPRGTMDVPKKTSDRDAIFISKTCAPTKSLTHVLGIYFGLFQTFESAANGAELVDGSNCATAGDLICDTPADPSPATVVDGNCDLDPAATDANGDYYTPDACNIMSFYSSCKNIYFTTGQYDRMLEIMENGRNYLW